MIIIRTSIQKFIRLITILPAILLFLLSPSYCISNDHNQTSNPEEEKDLVLWTTDLLQKNGSSYLGILFQNKPDWHTYWKNPGDAGTPFQFHFSVKNNPLILEEQEWPAPKTFLSPGDLISYGHEHRYAFFFKISDQQYQEIIANELTIQLQWLVCRHICLPGQDEQKIQIKNQRIIWSNAHTPQITVTEEEWDQHFQKIPTMIAHDPSDFVFKKDGKQLQGELRTSADRKKLFFHYQISPFETQDMAKQTSILTPFPQKLVTFEKEKLAYDPVLKILYGRIAMEWDGEYAEGGPQEIPKNLRWKSPFELSFIWQDESLPQPHKLTFAFQELLSKDTPLFTQFHKAAPLSPSYEIAKQDLKTNNPTTPPKADSKEQSFFLPSSTPL
jgi:thiol:disulfide interchange protein DsbD